MLLAPARRISEDKIKAQQGGCCQKPEGIQGSQREDVPGTGAGARWGYLGFPGKAENNSKCLLPSSCRCHPRAWHVEGSVTVSWKATTVGIKAVERGGQVMGFRVRWISFYLLLAP